MYFGRKNIIDFFEFPNGPDFEKDSTGKKIYLSNQAILKGFSNLTEIILLFKYSLFKLSTSPS